MEKDGKKEVLYGRWFTLSPEKLNHFPTWCSEIINVVDFDEWYFYKAIPTKDPLISFFQSFQLDHMVIISR